MKDEFIECGSAPIVVGEHFPEPTECMFYLYMPVKMRWESEVRLPERLERYRHILELSNDDFGSWHDKFVYITAKTLFVTRESPGNRPGWHIDGFGSEGDVNYVWSDMNPTEFAVQKFRNVSSDDRQSMVDISSQIDPDKITRYPDCTVLRLDEKVVHRVSEIVEEGLRSFVKITVSSHQFRNAGNSTNHLFDYRWVMTPRGKSRNLDHG